MSKAPAANAASSDGDPSTITPFATQNCFTADRRDNDDPVAPPPELREAAFLKIGETFETRRCALACFKKRIAEYTTAPEAQQITFFGRDDNAYLLSFLRCKKMNVNEAWEKYFNFCKYYSRESWLFNVDTALVRRLYESRSFEVLTKRDASDRVILSMKCDALIPIVEEYGPKNVRELLKAIFCVLQILCFADIDAQVYGAVIVSDMRGYKLQVVRFLSLPEYKLCLDLCQWCLPLRANGLYIYSEPFYVRAVLGALRPFMKPNVRANIICFEQNLASLHSVVPKTSLPSHLGGSLQYEPSQSQRWTLAVHDLLARHRTAHLQ